LLALAHAHDRTAVIVLSGAVGVCVLGATFALYGVAAGFYPAEIRGTGSGAAVSVGRLGSIVGPLMAGMLLGGGGTSQTVILSMVPAAAMAGLAAFYLKRAG
jgi:AAHS family 3-hydroxyphenylpropionic acid transporter